MLNAVHCIWKFSDITSGLTNTATVTTTSAVSDTFGGFQYNYIFCSGFCKVVGCGTSDNTAADNDYICCLIHVHHPDPFLKSPFQSVS